LFLLDDSLFTRCTGHPPDLAFTPDVRARQSRMGSRSAYARLDHAEDRHDALTGREAEFIAQRDGFYQATVSQTGWPYVQFRGGLAGFLKVLDPRIPGVRRPARQPVVRERG
jgi:hypothetical protein